MQAATILKAIPVNLFYDIEDGTTGGAVYYCGRTEGQTRRPDNCIRLASMTDCYAGKAHHPLLASSSHPSECIFTLHTANSAMLLMASSQAYRDAWRRALIVAVQSWL